jgi:hypothetical protein
MSHYVTRIDTSKLDEESYGRLLKALEYCHEHDKFKSFEYRITGRVIRITSPNVEIAKKRGSYFRKKFGVYYNIIREL